MSDVPFGRLTDLKPREAWAHEALTFTPWLAANLEQLWEVLQIPLDLTGKEMAVETFSADILARDASDGTVVLIENQLEQTDHTHLGQIMTYLAGLEAQTVIWVAPHFREPHLSAIRWLNQHTADGFSFFAVRLRVVRIADSLFAPIFEVVERPNDWDRRLTEARREATGDSLIGNRRESVWTAYLERYPGAAEWGLTPARTSSVWAPVPGLTEEANVSLRVGNEKSGAFLRAGRGSDGAVLMSQLRPHADELEARLDARFEASNGNLLARQIAIGLNHPERQGELVDWLENARIEYLSTISEILGRAA